MGQQIAMPGFKAMPLLGFPNFAASLIAAVGFHSASKTRVNTPVVTRH